MDTAQSQDEAELCTGMKDLCKQAGDDAFTQIYYQTSAGIYAYLRGLCGCPHQAEDLMQTTYYFAYRSFANFKKKSSPRSWLHVIATNTFRDYWRCSVQVQEVGADMLDFVAGGDANALDQIIYRQECRQMKKAVSCLSPELRATWLLVRVKGMKYREAAKILGTSLATVRMQIHRAHHQVVANMKSQ